MKITFHGEDVLELENRNKALEFTSFDDGELLIEAEDLSHRDSVSISLTSEAADALEKFLSERKKTKEQAADGENDEK